MTNRITRRELLGTSALGVSAGLAGCTAATPFVGKRRTFSREFDLQKGSIAIRSQSGYAKVTRTDADVVRVHGVKQAASVFASLSDATLEATRTGDHLELDASVKNSSFFGFGNATISVSVGVPDGVSVEMVAARNGIARATDVAGDVELLSTNGNAVARDVDGSVSAMTTNGNVHIEGVTGFRGAQTTNGDVDVEIPAIDGDVSASSTNGNVDAALSSDLDATVVATTTNGRVASTGLSLGSSSSSAHRLSGTLGDGTHNFRAESQNGNVRLSQLRAAGSE